MMLDYLPLELRECAKQSFRRGFGQDVEIRAVELTNFSRTLNIFFCASDGPMRVHGCSLMDEYPIETADQVNVLARVMGRAERQRRAG